MSNKLCAPYEGNQPYLYISYCSEDMDVILPILRVLRDEGYRIGYDDSCDSGSEWSSIAARRLDQSAVFLALISENWIASQKNLEEFTFAQMKRQPSLAVILDQVQLTPAIKLQLASVPAVDRSQCIPREFRNKLLEQIDKLDLAIRHDSEFVPTVSWNKRVPIIAAAAVLIFMAGIVATVLAHGRAKDPQNTPILPDILVESNTGISPSPELLDYSAAYHIFLDAPKDMSQEEFSEALSTLRDRLDIFTGREPYEINVTGNSVELYLPKSAFAGIDVETVLKYLITSATKLYIFNRSLPNSARESIRRDDLASVTLSQGTVPGVNAAQYGIYSSTYDYLTIELTDQCAEWFGKEIAAWGDRITFGQDMEGVLDHAYYPTVPAGDGKTFYIIFNANPGGRLLETLLYNLTHSPLPDSFSFTIDLNSLADWQTIESGNRMGENQCDPAALKESTVTFILESSNSVTVALTVEEQLNMEKELKARLDALDQPYALGRVENENENENTAVFAVRTGMEHMGLPIIQLIGDSMGGGKVHLRGNYWNIDLTRGTFTWGTSSGGTCTLALEVKSNVTEQLAELTGEMADQDDTLRLTAGDLPLLGASIWHGVSEGRIVFDYICFGQGAEITEEYQWLTEFLERIMNEFSTARRLYLANIQMNLEDGAIGYDESRFGISYAMDEQQFADAVHAIVPNAVVMDNQDLSQVCVYLDLEVNEDLPERAAALAQEIYEASGFERSIFQTMAIYLIEEDSSVDERAQIFFKKFYGRQQVSFSLAWSSNGYTYVEGFFRGGRLDRYKSAFQHIVETDPFYLRLTLADKTYWRC